MVIREKLARYFNSGCKNKSDKFNVGLELEHFVVDKNLKSIGYYDGVKDILEQIKDNYKDSLYSKGNIIALYDDYYTITLEPGAQIEVSIISKDKIKDIENIYKSFRKVIDPVLNKKGFSLITQGYLPKTRVKDISLIPKDRYVFMDKYFKNIGLYGEYMMKGTASTQVSIDYYDEEDFSVKYFIAYILSPVLSYITSNCPTFEGEKNSDPLLRHKIWENVDKDRFEVINYMDDYKMTFNSYADFILNCPLIVKKEKDGVSYCPHKVKDIYKVLDDENTEHITSMVFPDVRVKKYIEIRYADSLPIDLALGYSALIKGLFTDTKSVCDLISTFKDKDIGSCIKNIRLYKSDAVVFGIKLSEITDRIFDIAYKNLDCEDSKYLDNLKELVK